MNTNLLIKRTYTFIHIILYTHYFLFYTFIAFDQHISWLSKNGDTGFLTFTVLQIFFCCSFFRFPLLEFLIQKKNKNDIEFADSERNIKTLNVAAIVTTAFIFTFFFIIKINYSRTKLTGKKICRPSYAIQSIEQTFLRCKFYIYFS